jgi:type II secretion system protein N
MRLPRLRLPRLSLSFDWLSALGGRTTLLYAGYTSVLFIVFLVVTFPHELLIRRALSAVNRGPVAVEFNAARFAWLDGYELSGTRVAPAVADQPPYIEVSHLWVRPALGSLVRGNPYDLLVRADVYGGAAQAELNMTDGSVVGNLQWQGLELGRYRTLTSLLDEGQLAGRVSGQFSFEARGGNFNAGQGSGVIVLEGASLTGAKVAGFGVPDLHFRQAKLKVAVRAGHLDIQEFQANGDASLQGSGQVQLRDPMPESVLNLHAIVETSLATPDPIKGLMALLPHAPNAKPDAPTSIVLTGTLGHPRVR